MLEAPPFDPDDMRLDAMTDEELAALPDARVEDAFARTHAAIERLEVRRLRLLAEVDRRRSFERDGFLSTATWLAGSFRLAYPAARKLLHLARAIRQMPRTARALTRGEISGSALELLARAREVDPPAFEAAEPELVEAATRHSIAGLSRVLTSWRLLADAARGGDPDERLRARRNLYISSLLDGMTRVDGELSPEGGEYLQTAVTAVLDAEAHSREATDMRSPAQRRADALEEICRAFLDRSDRPSVGGERPHVTLTVGADSLRADTGTGELDHAGPVGARLARKVACDASIRRVVMAGTSEPLDVGRATPVVPAAIRRAVVARDRHCRFPGCDRPRGWCDAHHVVHWADGGATALTNLVLLCRRHHGSVHAGGFGLEMVAGVPVFTRPDGSTLDDPVGDRGMVDRGPPARPTG